MGDKHIKQLLSKTYYRKKIDKMIRKIIAKIAKRNNNYDTSTCIIEAEPSVAEQKQKITIKLSAIISLLAYQP